jgi:hypothetical protein
VSAAEHPRVFLSHASEDKARFVLPFAEGLRERGLDVWMDKWEMLPGDSLVAKIFVEGLDKAAAVIVVISRTSLTKRWVAEELDAAVVKRIEDGSKLIPVVLDGLKPAEIPAPIRHLLFEAVPNPSDLDEVIDSIVRAIHGVVEKPPLGRPPGYASAPAASIDGLDRIDSLVLRSAGNEAVRDCGNRFDTAEFLTSVIAELSISEADATESLEVLDNVRVVKIRRTMGNGIPSMRTFDLTGIGLETYLRAYEPEYPKIEATVIARLAGWTHDQGSERELTEAVGAPRLIVQHVLDRCAARGLLKLSRTSGPSGAHFFGISPRLRRLARG